MRKLVRMKSCTALMPRAGSGSAGSAHTTSSVSSSAIAETSHSFQASA